MQNPIQRFSSRRQRLEHSFLAARLKQAQAYDRIAGYFSSSLFEVVGELERIGDYAKGIAKICLLIGDQPHVKPLVDIPLMCKLTVDMMHRAVGAFVRADVEQAQKIPAEDDLVDALYVQVYRDLVQIMTKDPSTVDQSNHLMWAAHNLERMADRVTNICERAVYVATGKLVEIENSPESFRLSES